MKLETYIPCDLLKPYIKSFVIQETDEEQSYKVLPGTGLVIGFQYSGKLAVLKDNDEITLATSGITGLHDSYKIFKNSPGIGTVLVLFKEGGATHFFKEPIHELFRESLSLDNFMLRSELLLLEEKLCEAKSDKIKIDVIEQFLLARITHTEPDKLVLEALSLIHKSKGNIRIKELTEQLHISQSPLEKRFRKAVGASPKKYASIVRLKTVLEQFKNNTLLTSLSYESGFFDQSHFIKEFKNFTGETPENFFLNKP